MKLFSAFLALAAVASLTSASSDEQKHLVDDEDRDLKSRIVGGVAADPGEFPFMAQMETSTGFQFCGGSLIGNQYVLTAAHCTINSNHYVRVGTNRRGAGGQRIRVAGVVSHDDYTGTGALPHDIMVVKLETPFIFNSEIGEIALNEDDELPTPGTSLTVIGFGTTQFNGNSSPNLLKVSVPAVSTGVCRSQNGGGITDDFHLCAGLLAGGKDSCQGDSGGPIFEDRLGTLYQVGIVSWGQGCADAASSGVYTRITGYNGWIQDAITQLNRCSTDADCTSPFVCNRGTGACVECTSGDDCNSGNCNLNTNLCEAVTPSPVEPISNAPIVTTPSPVAVTPSPVAVTTPSPVAPTQTGCAADTDCPGGVCIEETGECVQCLRNRDCNGNPNGAKCDPLANMCVECFRNRHCAGNLNGDIACDEESATCVGCTRNWDCRNNPDGKLGCDVEQQECVECTRHAHCPGGCDEASNTCVECTKHAHCSGNTDGKVACDVVAQQCVECTANRHCAGNVNGLNACDQNTNLCVGCTRNGQCDDPLKCHKETTTCVECFKNWHCGPGISCDLGSLTCS